MNTRDRIALHLDKVQHLAVGTGITVVFGLLHPLLGQAVCLFAAWQKEEHDRKRPDRHTRDGWDAYATAFGVLPGGALLEWALPPLKGALASAIGATL